MIPIFPGPGSAELKEGESISFGLRFLGPLGKGEMELVFAALEKMSEFDLGDEGGRVVFESAEVRGRKESLVEMGIDEPDIERIEVVFETPAWIEHQGKLLERIEFQPLFRSIFRRLCILCALYGQAVENEDEQFARLDTLAGKIAVVKQDLKTLQWNRRSIAREREHPLRGLIGRVVFSGAELGAFLPILRLAEKTHIGKSTSHGLGRMRVIVEK